MTIYQELRNVRKAIDDLVNGAQSATVSSAGGQHTYSRPQLFRLQEREEVLLRRISKSNVRKRTAPDFS